MSAPGTLPARVTGVVERGDERGRDLGFPTANIAGPDVDQRDGVYVGTVILPSGEHVPSVVSLGRRPTYYGRDGVRLLEAHLLGWSGDLYGHRIVVELQHLLRPQRRFKGSGDLVAQIGLDLEVGRDWFAREGPLGTPAPTDGSLVGDGFAGCQKISLD